MARMAFKPDSSFFRKIAIGAVGSRAVCGKLNTFGHSTVELERGSTDVKLWKDVKRKRVRIPDIVCVRCGQRIESRAKSKIELSMSHSPTDVERSWDFGMIDTDWVAFPVCEVATEELRTLGKLEACRSYWRERNWVDWRCGTFVNVFPVAAFRATAPQKSTTKGVTEGSETSIAWNATFSSRSGRVEAVSDTGITVRRRSDGHCYTWKFNPPVIALLKAGDEVDENQALASTVKSLGAAELQCPNDLDFSKLETFLQSRERTLRFTGVKLCRIRGEKSAERLIRSIAVDAEEDVYNRLEAASYLVAVAGDTATSAFAAFFRGFDEQTQLEAVIALGEAGTEGALHMLSRLLEQTRAPFFLRSAAAWALSRNPAVVSGSALIAAFADCDTMLREEALDGLIAMGGPAVPLLLKGINDANSDIAAGCAEVLRQSKLPPNALDELGDALYAENTSTWVPWVAAHLPRDYMAGRIAALQEKKPELHYAISLLWAFLDSWISRSWELGSNEEKN